MKDNVSIVFVGGAPRSGTTLVQKCLSFHSEILAGAEFENMPDIVRLYRRMSDSNARGKHGFYCELDDVKKHLREFTYNIFLSKTTEDVRLISEKTPDNVMVFRELSELFPEAKFIFVLRDPRATLSSLKDVASRLEQAGKKSRFGQGFRKDIVQVRKYIQAGERFLDEFPERCLLVKYEEVIRHPKDTLTGMVEFLGLAFQEDMLSIGDAQHKAQRKDRVLNPWNYNLIEARSFDTSSMERWKQGLTEYEKSLVALNFSGLRVVNENYSMELNKNLEFYFRNYCYSINSKVTGS